MKRVTNFFVFALVALLGAAALSVQAESGSGSGGSSGGGGGDDFKLKANLFGNSVMSGKATYRERPRDGQIERRFKVQVEDGAPGQFLAVHVDDYLAGVIQLNSLGRVEFQLRTPAFIDSPGDGEPMPADFPIIIDEDMVTVGPLSGVFFDRQFTLPGNENLVSSKYRVKSDLNGATLMSGKAVYRERIKNGGLERRFQVEVEDALANTTYNITLNGSHVGQLTTNGFGFAEFQLRTAAFIDSPGDGQPMPDSFPSLTAGDQVVVGPVSGTLQND
jgi:hypothetical protein